MKLTSRESSHRLVNYFDMIFTVSSEYRWIATDENGAIWVFDAEPHVRNDAYWDCDTDCIHIANADLEGMDFKTTLREIEIDTDL